MFQADWIKLRFNGSDIGVDQIVEQTGLFRAHLLAALGELEALELGDLVAKFFDQRFVVMDLLVHDLNGLAHRLDLLVERRDALQQLRRQSAQLFGIQLVEVGDRSHADDLARST